MIKRITILCKQLCLAFIMLYGINIILANINILIPINIITIVIVTLLGVPGILGLLATYFLI